jgi:hypothetical protein
MFTVSCKTATLENGGRTHSYWLESMDESRPVVRPDCLPMLLMSQTAHHPIGRASQGSFNGRTLEDQPIPFRADDVA